MQRFFDGFDKARLVLGSSVFYLAALAIMMIFLSYNPNKPFVKNNPFRDANNLKGVVNTPTQARFSSDNLPLGYQTKIVLGQEMSFEVVTGMVGILMRSKDLEDVSMVLDCSRADCKVEFTIADDSQRYLAKRANDELHRFLSRLIN